MTCNAPEESGILYSGIGWTRLGCGGLAEHLDVFRRVVLFRYAGWTEAGLPSGMLGDLKRKLFCFRFGVWFDGELVLIWVAGDCTE